ncbi:MAG: 4a-hydroxytetrahydrobiopterin dehydratase [Actinomycetes bacterium]
MTRPTALTPDELQAALGELADWAFLDDRLHAAFTFDDFAAAFAFMTAVAAEAEALDHHPDWSNSWNRVVVDLVTHDVGGVTSLDVELARRISVLAAVAIRP